MGNSQVAALPVQVEGEHRNDVVLVGRVAAEPETRELPSGDVVVTWRLIVGRGAAASARNRARKVTIDTFDCAAWSAKLRRTVSGWREGDVVEVCGALRRRFWQSGAGPASRVEVEVATARRLRGPSRSATGRRRLAGRDLSPASA